MTTSRCSENTKRKIGRSNSIIGQRRLMKNGYIRVTISTYPRYKRVYEHRYIIEKLLGRKLKFNETVHHKNKDKTDNRVINLVLISREEHNRRQALEAIKSGGYKQGRFCKI